MEYRTKFDIDSEVWLMHRNKAVRATVKGIRINHFVSPVDYTEKLCESYLLSFSETECDWVSDDNAKKLFRTKQELIESL